MEKKKISFCSEPIRDYLHSEVAKPYTWNSCCYFDVVVLSRTERTWFAFFNVYRKRLWGKNCLIFGNSFFPAQYLCCCTRVTVRRIVKNSFFWNSEIKHRLQYPTIAMCLTVHLLSIYDQTWMIWLWRDLYCCVHEFAWVCVRVLVCVSWLILIYVYMSAHVCCTQQYTFCVGSLSDVSIRGWFWWDLFIFILLDNTQAACSLTEFFTQSLYILLNCCIPGKYSMFQHQ